MSGGRRAEVVIHARQVIVAACLVALGLAACSGDDDASGATDTTAVEDTTTTTTSSPTSTTTVEPAPPDTTGMDDEAQIRAVVDFVEQLVLVTDDPDDPLLSQYLSGRALERISGVLRQGAAGGYSVRGTRAVEVAEVFIGKPRADALACVATDFETLDSSGAVVDTVEVSVVVRFELQQENGLWKVEETGDKDSRGMTESCEVGD